MKNININNLLKPQGILKKILIYCFEGNPVSISNLQKYFCIGFSKAATFFDWLINEKIIVKSNNNCYYVKENLSNADTLRELYRSLAAEELEKIIKESNGTCGKDTIITDLNNCLDEASEVDNKILLYLIDLLNSVSEQRFEKFKEQLSDLYSSIETLKEEFFIESVR